jgi:hypothetical protein
MEHALRPCQLDRYRAVRRNHRLWAKPDAPLARPGTFTETHNVRAGGEILFDCIAGAGAGDASPR